MTKRKELTVTNLAQLIRDNPEAVFIVDNDYWEMLREPAGDNPHDDEEAFDEYDDWEEDNRICSSDEMGYHDNGYGSGSNYGGDILQALALLQGVTVESV